MHYLKIFGGPDTLPLLYPQISKYLRKKTEFNTAEHETLVIQLGSLLEQQYSMQDMHLV